MALTRSALREKGITDKEILDFIMEEHGNTLESAKEKAKEAADLAAGRLQEKIDALQGQIENAPKPDGEDWKAKYEAEVTAHGETKKTMQKTYDDFKAGVDAEKTTAAKLSALEKSLLEAGASAKYVKKIAKDFTLDTLELDGENIKDFDKALEPVKASWSDLFGEVKTEGAQPAYPPAGGNGNKNYVALLDAARKAGNTQEAVRIKTEASKEGVILI